MGSNIYAFIGILLCLMVLIVYLYKDKLIYAFFRLILAGIAIYVVNLILPQYTVGINLITVSYVGILGVPGIMTLYLLRWML